MFVEEDNFERNQRNYEDYKKLCNLGRGAMYFISMRSAQMQHYEFKGHLSSVVVFLGYPLLNEQDIHTK